MTRLFNQLFDQPAMLVLFAVVAAVFGLMLWSLRARLTRLAPWPRLRDQARRSGASVLWPVVGLALLALAAAGPRWFTRSGDPLAPGRDVMIVLDLSRSMRAEQPSRAAKAIRSLRTLTDPAKLPPGTRVGLIVFAARPALMFPLTHDLDHLG